MRSETRYVLRRASEEAHRALSSDEPAVAEVHEELSVRYSVKAANLLAGEDEIGTANRTRS
jgi:hypothetical protein